MSTHSKKRINYKNKKIDVYNNYDNNDYEPGNKSKQKIFSRNIQYSSSDSDDDIIEHKHVKPKTNHQNEKEIKQFKINSLLEQMILSTIFFKYTSNGYAHFRMFRLSQDKNISHCIQPNNQIQ